MGLLPTSLRAAAVAAVSSARSAICLWTSFVDVQRSAVQISAVKTINGGVPFRIDTHFDKGEASGLSSVTVSYDVHAIYGAVCFEHGTNGIFGRPEAEVTYKYIAQLFSSF
jgi:hypothetical protein